NHRFRSVVHCGTSGSSVVYELGKKTWLYAVRCLSNIHWHSCALVRGEGLSLTEIFVPPRPGLRHLLSLSQPYGFAFARLGLGYHNVAPPALDPADIWRFGPREFSLTFSDHRCFKRFWAFCPRQAVLLFSASNVK